MAISGFSHSLGTQQSFKNSSLASAFAPEELLASM
jgi:hypothetical protein